MDLNDDLLGNAGPYQPPNAQPQVMDPGQMFMQMMATVNQLTATVNTLLTQQPSRAPTSVKLAEPDKFDGQAKHVEIFIRQVQDWLFFSASAFPTSRHKSVFMGSYLAEGTPLAWFNGVRQTEEHLLDDFDLFIQRFRTHFGDTDQQGTAQRDLENLKQTTTVAAYAARFREVTSWLPLSQFTLCEAFWKGLKPDVRQAFIYMGKPKDLNGLEHAAINVDNRLQQYYHDLAMQHLGTNPSSSVITPEVVTEIMARLRAANLPMFLPPPIATNPALPPLSAQNPHSTPYVPITSSMDSNVPMEIDAVTVHGHPGTGPLPPAERQRRIDNKLCLYCGEAGHYSKICPTLRARQAAAVKKTQK